MPDPTIQDVLDKLDNVLDEIDKVLKKCNKIKDQIEIWNICSSCKGLGYIIGYTDAHDEIHTVCPNCNGNKKTRQGQLEGGTEE